MKVDYYWTLVIVSGLLIPMTVTAEQQNQSTPQRPHRQMEDLADLDLGRPAHRTGFVRQWYYQGSRPTNIQIEGITYEGQLSLEIGIRHKRGRQFTLITGGALATVFATTWGMMQLMGAMGLPPGAAPLAFIPGISSLLPYLSIYHGISRSWWTRTVSLFISSRFQRPYFSSAPEEVKPVLQSNGYPFRE